MFYGEDLLALRPNLMMKDHPFSVSSLFNKEILLFPA